MFYIILNAVHHRKQNFYMKYLQRLKTAGLLFVSIKIKKKKQHDISFGRPF